MIKILPIILIFISLAVSSQAKEFYSYENVMGTSLELYVDADKKKADKCVSLILEEIERLNSCFSTEVPDSEISILNSKTGKVEISKDLFTVLKKAQKYQAKSNGAYSIAITPLTNLWNQAVHNKSFPDSRDVHKAVALKTQTANCQLWETENKYYCQKNSGSFNLYSLAKGYIMDRCLEKACKEYDLESVILNIGGDILCRSKSAESILDICNPFQHNDNDPSFSTVKIKNGALATSGNYARYFEIQGKKYSHIIDGRSGMPVKEIVSATVWTANAVDADALATMASILKPEETMDIINSIKDCECLLVSGDGKVLRSKNFAKLELAFNFPMLCIDRSAGAWGPHSVTINFKLENSTPGKRFHKHYTIVWIEDSRGKIIRHLAIWMRKKKTKYLPSVKNWWNGGGKKITNDKKIMSMSRATRPPGSYSLSWDGLDDEGHKCKAGTYTVHIEVSREHGPKKVPMHTEVKIDCGRKANKKTTKDLPEIQKVSVEYK